MKSQRENWGSLIGVVLAVMGSAIGLGNFIRFPGLAAKYEGGTFMIPYFFALIFLGIPIAWMEWTIGRTGGQKGFHSTPGIFRILWKNPLSPYLGFLGLLVPVGIFMYYIIIEAWSLYYAFLYLVGSFPLFNNDPNVYKEFFVRSTGINQDGILFDTRQTPVLFFVLFCYLLNMWIIYRGLVKGIEVVSKIGIPLLFVISFVILIRVLTLGTPNPEHPERNVINGLGFMWNPDTSEKSFFESLLNADMWLAAAGQIFFSLSVGFGVIITYASYLKKDDDVILSGTTSAAGNSFAEVALGGLITIPAAFIFLGQEGITDSVFQLGFITLPNVFEKMPLGGLFGFLWFFLLFIAALTSSISMLQPAIAFFEEGLNVGRRASISLLSFVTLMGTLFVMFFSKDLIALDNMDFWIGTLGIFLLATIQILIGGWIYGAEKVYQEAQVGSIMKIPRLFVFVIKYISPAYLLIIFISWLYQKLPLYVETLVQNPTARITFSFVVLLSLFFILLIAQANRNWNKQSQGV
ncbi:MAG: sodium-dependent transporter [Leptospiraceae bacterium]|nr:sodium-dependent transporter [Leptospiraceae bacterium]MDW7976978.1 sodium-dependent transporter [Leptospiraceae bacterium]